MADPTKPGTVKSVKGTSAQGAMDSKKFKAFLISTLGWNVLIGVGIYKWMPPDQWATIILLAMIVVQGVVEVGYIVGQAGLDAMTHLFDTITPDSIFGMKVKPKAAKSSEDEKTDEKPIEDAPVVEKPTDP